MIRRFALLLASSAFVANGLNATGSICNGKPIVSPESDWVWSTSATPSPSCSSPPVINNAKMCQGDPTSIVLQASGNPECLASKMECPFSMYDFDQLDFDVQMLDCKGTWAAPLWMSPNHWEGGGDSGEVDMLENCPTDLVRSNFAAGGDQVAWSSNGDVFFAHTTMWKLADQGTGVQSIHVKACADYELKADGTCPIDGAAYLNDIYGKYGCSNGDCVYHMISDLWNGVDGDGGWIGCTGRTTNYGSNCRFSITNIRVKGVPFTGKCAVMSSTSPTPTPSPSPPPSPAPSPSGGTCCFGGSTCATTSDCHADAYCDASESNCRNNCAGVWCYNSDVAV